MPAWDGKYQVIDIPAPDPQVLAEFESLPFDEFTGAKQRYRRFSQFRMSFDVDAESWRLDLLPYRPFLQPKMVNGFVGGVQRPFPPLRIDPSAQLDAGAKALGLDRTTTWQINVHQCRVISTPEIEGLRAPRCPRSPGC